MILWNDLTELDIWESAAIRLRVLVRLSDSWSKPVDAYALYGFFDEYKLL